MVQRKVIDNNIEKILRIQDREKMLEELVLYAIRNGCNKVEDIVTMIGNNTNNPTINEILDTIKRLERKSIILYDPNIRSFMHYISNFYHSFTFWLTLLITFIALITIYILPTITPWNMIRIIVGGVFMMFIPGYALTQLLFPKMDKMEKIALSIGLSIAIDSLIGLLLNYTPFGIRLDPIVAFISIVSIALALASVYRMYTINMVNGKK